jgi:DNA-binding NarL/FixJ family response regulator
MNGGPEVRPRIVVCEEGCGHMESLRAALPQAAFEIVSCPTAEHVLEGAHERSPDAILVRSNGGCGAGAGIGAGALRVLRRLHPHVPLVILSEGTSLEWLRQAQHLRPIFFVLEPLDPIELRDTIEAVIAQRARRSPTQPRGRALP